MSWESMVRDASARADELFSQAWDGPHAFHKVRLFNQELWRSNPARAEENMRQAVATGGFGLDCIDRRVGNYEGQIMAIRAGYVDLVKRHGLPTYRISEKGRQALRDAGDPEPIFLCALDGWHSRSNYDSTFEYCAYEVVAFGRPMLRLFAKAVPQGDGVGMEPHLRREDVEQLRDYLTDYLERTKQ